MVFNPCGFDGHRVSRHLLMGTLTLPTLLLKRGLSLFALRPASCRLVLIFLLWPMHLAFADRDTELRTTFHESPLIGRLGAVGMISVGGQGLPVRLASAFLISPCHVLTAAHVLAQVGKGAQIGTAVRFVPSASLASPLWGRVVAANHDFIMREFPVAPDLNSKSQDWGLIELDHPVDGIEPLKLLYPGSPIPGKATFSIAGYPMTGQRALLNVQEHCVNRSRFHGSMEVDGVVLLDCAVRPGMSGGPLLVDGNGELVAAGIVVERFEVGQKVLGVAIPIKAFAETIEARMRSSDVCAVGSPFALSPNSDR